MSLNGLRPELLLDILDMAEHLFIRLKEAPVDSAQRSATASCLSLLISKVSGTVAARANGGIQDA